jgi:predicted transcriptional regulator of viral defense system
MARTAKVFRLKELTSRGIHPEEIRRLWRKGLLVRSSRGVYHLPNAEFSGNLSLAEVAKRVPRGVICLLTALRFHGVGTQMPPEVWLALHRRAARPRLDRPRLRVVRFSGQAFTEGVEQHTADHVSVRVYSIAKTVADCFKYRNKIGLDVALEALREALKRRKITMDEIWKYARICRVARVMQPYLEAIA